MTVEAEKGVGKEELQKLNPASGEPVKNLDEFVRLGRYGCLVLLTYELFLLTSITSIAFVMYAGASPDVIGCGEIPFDSTENGCSVLTNLKKNSSLECEPRLKHQFYSVNVEFNLICEEGKAVKNSISYQMVAVTIGSVAGGQMSDLFGRRRTLIVCCLGTCLFTLASAFANSLFTWTVIRICNGFFAGGVTSVMSVWQVENMPKRIRLQVNTVLTWSPNFILFPIIAFFCGEWRSLSVACSLLAASGALSSWLMFESPRFLIQKGRIEEARTILYKIRHLNGDKNEEEEMEIDKILAYEQKQLEGAKKQKKHTFYHLFCTWKMMRWTLTLAFGNLTSSLVNYCILFNMEKLSGSLYLNNVFFGLIRWCMNMTVGLLDHLIPKMGRKTINFGAHFFIISCLSVIVGVYTSGQVSSLTNVIRLCSIVASAMCAQLYLAKFMTSTELYPTAVRNLANSVLAMSSRIGTIFGPQLYFLSYFNPSYPYLSLLIFCSTDLLFFQTVMPETKGRNLENHLPPKEERIGYKQKVIDV